MKQNRIRFCINYVCIVIVAATFGFEFSTAEAQENGAINRLDRGSDLPILKFSGTDETFFQVFRFQCTEDQPLNVVSFSLVDPESNFSAEQSCDCYEMPLTFEPGELIGVRITLRAKDLNVHRNRIRFVLADGAAPIFYDIEAQRTLTKAGVNSTGSVSQNISMSMAPNPSSGNVSIELTGTDKADISIFDLSGKTIATKSAVTSWIWNGESLNGTAVPSGNYLVRATTRDIAGKPVATTKNIVISR